MASAIPVKSILKQRTGKKASPVTDERKAQAEKDRKNLEIALHHAHRIQNQKDVEARILDSITKLLDFPAAQEYTGNEAVEFVERITPFQPSDMDSLIEERRIDGKCGYALCLNSPRATTMGASSEWKLKKGMADYCSGKCAEKNIYVRAQLSQIPAWERTYEQQPDVQLHEDDQTPVRRAKRAARVDTWRSKVADEEELAMERGETTLSFRPKQVIADSIIEKRPSKKIPRAPDADEIDNMADAIEGFQPKRIGKDMFKKYPSDDEDDEDEKDDD